MLISVNMQAQNLQDLLKEKGKSAANKAQREVNKEVNKEIDKEVDEAVEEGINSLRNLFNQEPENRQNNTGEGETPSSGNINTQNKQNTSNDNSAQQESYNALQGLFGGTGNVKTQDVYEYDGTIHMVVKTYDSNGEDDSFIYKTYFSKESKSYAMKLQSADDENVEQVAGRGFMIFDFENKAMIILSEQESQKTGFVSPLDMDNMDSLATGEESNYQDDARDFHSNYKKTGRTKTINGYTCHEYEYKDERGKINIWSTDELDFSWAHAFGSLNQAASWSATGYGNDEFVMEMYFEDAESKEKTEVTITDVNLDKKETIDISGYQLMNFSNFQAPENENQE